MMFRSHLSPGALIEALEGVARPRAARHLTQCAACRERLTGLQQTLDAAVGSPVPEPSPLFWDHLAARIREDVDHAGGPAAVPSPVRDWLAARGVRLAAVAGAMALVVFWFVGPRGMNPPPGGDAPVTPVAPTVPKDAGEPAAAAWASQENPDESWQLVADLSDVMTADADVDGLLATAPGQLDGVADSLSDDERETLVRLLQAELARPGV